MKLPISFLQLKMVEQVENNYDATQLEVLRGSAVNFV